MNYDDTDKETGDGIGISEEALLEEEVSEDEDEAELADEEDGDGIGSIKDKEWE